MNKLFVAYFKNEDEIVIVKVKVSHNLERTDNRAYILIDLQTGTGLKYDFITSLTLVMSKARA